MNEERKPSDDERNDQTDAGPERKPSPAGPRDDARLTNPDATPGAGSLPADKATGESDAGVG